VCNRFTRKELNSSVPQVSRRLGIWFGTTVVDFVDGEFLRVQQQVFRRVLLSREVGLHAEIRLLTADQSTAFSKIVKSVDSPLGNAPTVRLISVKRPKCDVGLRGPGMMEDAIIRGLALK
jgi:hypothetical protein